MFLKYVLIIANAFVAFVHTPFTSYAGRNRTRTHFFDDGLCFREKSYCYYIYWYATILKNKFGINVRKKTLKKNF